MARPKKPTAEDAGELMVSVESYTRTRDSPAAAVPVSFVTCRHGLDLATRPAAPQPPPSPTLCRVSSRSPAPRDSSAMSALAHLPLLHPNLPVAPTRVNTPRRDATPPPIPSENTANTPSYQQVIVSLSNLQAGLAHVQSGLNELLRAYLEHTNSVIAGEDGVLDKLSLGKEIAATANTAIEAASSTANGIAQAITASDKMEAVEASGKPVKGTKRKREKKEKDPNAPKKPLTAAFLYAQTARPIVRGDLEAALGPDQKLEPNAVNLEVNKRWNEMPAEDKETWKQSYRDSMEAWKEEMAAYIASKGPAAVVDLHDDDEASEADVEIEVAAESDDSSEDEEPAPAKAPTPPIKTPRANKRQKTSQNPPVNGAAAPVLAAASPVPLPRSASVAAPAAVTETPAKKERKKKEKAAPQAIAPAPAAKEPSPEEGTKKKSKSSRTTRNNEPETAGHDKENVAVPEKKKRERKRKSEGAAA